MKKFTVFLSVIAAILAFSYCSSSKKAATATVVPAKITYTANTRQIFEANCAPCHFPDKGGNKKPLDTYTNATAQIDQVLRRVQLNPGDRGFMPARHPKLSDSTINMLKQWKEDGLMEK